MMISLLISACSTTREQGISRAERRHQAKLANLVAVKKAVESRRYIIRMDRLYMTGGSFIDLVPTNNYIVVDGGAASISLAYVGRSIGRPISGINFNGQTTKYKLDSNEGKSVYNIDMEIKFRDTRFDLYVNIGSAGRCNVSVINSRIQSVRYTGYLIPIAESAAGNSGNTDQLKNEIK